MVADPQKTGAERDSDGESPLTRTYVRVVLLEAAIVLALWFLGRMFS